MCYRAYDIWVAGTGTESKWSIEMPEMFNSAIEKGYNVECLILI